MKVVFADSFWESLKVMSRHQTWWYKTYETFRYKIPMFFKNVWYFRKELWRFRGWDYTFNLDIFARSLEKTAHVLEFYGHEVDGPRLKKVEKIKRVITIIKNLDESNYIDMAEQEIGELKNLNGWASDREDSPEEKEHNRKVFDRAKELEKKEYEELWQILKGQDKEEFSKIYEKLSNEEKWKHEHWENWFDGSGITSWWD